MPPPFPPPLLCAGRPPAAVSAAVTAAVAAASAALGGTPAASVSAAARHGLSAGLGARSLAVLALLGADLGDALADRDLQRLAGALVVVEVFDADARQAGCDGALDSVQIAFFIGADKGERLSRSFSSRGAADAVDVVRRDVRHVEVHDVLELLDVDAARDDVGGAEHADLAVLEAGERLGALGLAAVSVHTRVGDPGLLPPLAKDRLQRRDDGSVVVGFRRVWSDGTAAIVLSPLELVERLVALVPPPRANQVIYRGVLAGNAAWRAEVVPSPPPETPEAAKARRAKRLTRHPRMRLAGERPSWSDLLERVFRVHGFACPGCGGPLTLRCVVVNPAATRRILDGLRRATGPPGPDLAGDDRKA